MAVFGGSLGARRINQAVAGLADRWKDRDDRSDLPHRRAAGTGTSRPDPVRAVAGDEAPDHPGLGLVRVPYEDRMDLVYRRRRPGGVPGRGDDRGRAGRRPACPRSWCRCPAPPATTRRPTPGCSSGPGRRCSSPTPSAMPGRWPDRLDLLLDDPAALEAMGGPRHRWAGPTPPPPAPGWWRRMPGPRAGERSS